MLVLNLLFINNTISDFQMFKIITTIFQNYFTKINILNNKLKSY